MHFETLTMRDDVFGVWKGNGEGLMASINCHFDPQSLEQSPIFQLVLQSTSTFNRASMSLPVPIITYFSQDIETWAKPLAYPISRTVEIDSTVVDVAMVPGIISLPDCNIFKTCQVCERGCTSTGIPCPNCGHINLR